MYTIYVWAVWCYMFIFYHLAMVDISLLERGDNSNVQYFASAVKQLVNSFFYSKL